MMTQAVPEIRTLWRLMKSSFTVLLEDFEENPGKFGIEGVRSLRHVIDCLLLDPRGFQLPSLEKIDRKTASEAGIMAEKVSAPKPVLSAVDPVQIPSRNVHSSDFYESGKEKEDKEHLLRCQTLQHARVFLPSEKSNEPRGSAKRPTLKSVTENVDSKRSYEHEEQAYIAAAWSRVVSGEIGRPECAAEVAEVLGRSKASIQGQFTWLKLSTARQAKSKRCKPASSSQAGEVSSAPGNVDPTSVPAESQYKASAVYNTMSHQRKRNADIPQRYQQEVVHYSRKRRTEVEHPLAASSSSPSRSNDSGDEDWTAEPIVVAKKRYIE